MICLFLTCDHPGADVDRIGSVLRSAPGMTKALMFTPAKAHDPFLDDGAPPALVLECYFSSIEPMEAALAADGHFAALRDVALWRERDRLFGSLSGGEKQRALLARAFVQQPRLLMLDEPTNHLDLRHQIELLSLVRKRRITTLATIHDLNLAAAFCDRLYVIANGAIVSQGSPHEVLQASMLKTVFGVEACVDLHPVLACPRITPFHRLPFMP